MSPRERSETWTAAAVALCREGRGWVPLKDALIEDIVGILNVVADVVAAFEINAETQPASGFVGPPTGEERV